ncbi:uncharacterized protein YutE (UPF0331/DUF86 family) [Paenibacillus phyllosphaerae]|uniref:Uncharacterized protein YutE (UPF0331/DUF86 family) n=1 Tax=Paenibacillus phyllosphaerae TaxID=274593 RepID=A0A7W5AW05_9BACL|nr:HepT-like ribonuclease domain-containing protein [Paenibacillus phyllosphaerae]MBB3109833.1 uncharacterized protein YutE (UPF0331/DUF86 family) [Paenibacillus phyllosphaerae]
MYYVNREQITVRLAVIPDVVSALSSLSDAWKGELLQGLAQERALHLAIETVTDVGSYLIDGFIMRDASSYEDIVTIIAGENVFEQDLLEPLLELVKLRKPLVQDYFAWPAQELHAMTTTIGPVLTKFKSSVEAYLLQELGQNN